MEDMLLLAKALGDPSRIRALMALRGRELCVCQIIELLGLAPSTVSKHMSVLRQAGLVRGRKKGRWMYYRHAGREAPLEARRAIRWVTESLSRDPAILDDVKRLAAITAREAVVCGR